MPQPPRRAAAPGPHLNYDGSVRVLYLSDRLSLRGGADRHLLQVITWAAGAGHRVAVAAGRIESEVSLPATVTCERVRDLASPVPAWTGGQLLERLLEDADLVHCQNVMNPVALAFAAATGRAVVTVQDHRLFCPGPGKTLPDGSRCRTAMSGDVCSQCLPDRSYRERMVELTDARRKAVGGARLVVLSRYMAEELGAAGLPGAQVIPPWVEVPAGEPEPGDAFLLAGRLVAHKAPLDAWQAWRRAGCGLPLRVAGAGSLERELEGAQRFGWLRPEALAGELRRSRALLLPARWQEPFGMIGVEALANATPVIAAATGGTGEWTDAGCLRVAAGDVGAMAAAMSTLAADPAVALALGRAGRAMVAERFARAPIEGRLRALYDAAAGFVASGAAG
jgi:glycosyltransferase involved in cell wall biosynthesis